MSGVTRFATHPDSRRRAWLCLALILLLAALLRGIGLQQVPHLTDETSEVLWAWDIAFDGALPLTHTDAYNGPFWAYLLAAALRIFGSSAALPRLFAMSLSLATVAATYALGWQLAPPHRRPLAAGLAAALMATAFTPVLVNGRVAWSNASTPLWTTLTLICLLRAARLCRDRASDSGRPGPGLGSNQVSGLDSGSGPWLLAAGSLAGLSLQSHPSVLVLLVAAAFWWLLDADRRAMLRGPWPWAAVGVSLVAYAPVIVFNLRDGFQTLSEASASVNWAPGDVAPGPAGSLAALTQLGRSVLGGFDLNGPTGDPVWIVASWMWAIGLLAAALLLARSRGESSPTVGRRMPLTLVGLALLGLPLFNRNWQGFLEARYLGYTLPLLFAAAGSVIAAHRGALQSGDMPHVGVVARSLPWRAWLWPVGITVLLLLPALRGVWWQRDAYREQYDNRRLWSMLDEAEAASDQGAAVFVDRELKDVAWRAGGQPRRAVEYLLTLEGIDFDQSPAEEMNHFLGMGTDIVMFLAGDTAETLREWGQEIDAIDIEPRPGEGDWGLYQSDRSTRP